MTVEAMVIEALADDEAVLRNRVADLEADTYVLREMLSIVLEKLAAATAREKRARERVHELSAKARDLREAA
jgi:hypothetical protein